MALDVAGRRHRNVHAREVMVRLLGIAGMVVHLGADMLRQVIELIVGGTAGVRIAPSPCRTFVAGID